MKQKAGLLDMSIIVVCFVILELIIRITAPLVSGNVKHIYEIPDIAANMAEEKEAVLFLGNSLIATAIDLNQFDSQAKLNMSYYKVVPDGTSLWDWSCIIKNTFLEKERLPKVVVLGYAWGQVKPVPSRLGGFFCSIRDLPDLIRMGMNNSSDVFEFLFSKVSRLYAMRETLRKRILDILVPDYRVHTQIINNEWNKKRLLIDKEKKAEDYQLLNAYMKMLMVKDIKPVIVAMPVRQGYILDDEFYRTVVRNGGIVLDYRKLDGIEKRMFRDPIHLNEQGRKIFTYHLAGDLKDI